MFVYLARPIDQAQESSWLNQLTIAIEHKLALAGIGGYKPNLAYLARFGDPDHAQYIDHMNRMAQFQADATLAILPAGMPTLGTPVEIEQALLLNQPVVIFTDILGSIQLAAWKRRGATVYDLSDIDFKLPESDELRFDLGRVPDPDEAASDNPRLLVKVDDGAYIPNRAHATDAGLDLATLRPFVLRAGSRVLIPTGVYAPPPEGWYGRITGRSSALSRLNVQVHEGIIDAGYTGELKISVTFQGRGGLDIPAGTRLAQYILAPVWSGEVEVVDELPETVRGDRGWGSSGE